MARKCQPLEMSHQGVAFQSDLEISFSKPISNLLPGSWCYQTAGSCHFLSRDHSALACFVPADLAIAFLGEDVFGSYT